MDRKKNQKTVDTDEEEALIKGTKDVVPPTDEELEAGLDEDVESESEDENSFS